ncbi:MAG TPA: hypothetical protein VFW65_35990 [Pseudonocardiaceae bacterium]|nr:hypothetical protein [Pseudonocardiaceae bacterium]
MGLTPTRRRRTPSAAGLNPVGWLVRWADWFEARGVYVPGEDSRSLSTWRDFGWLIVGGLIAVSAFVVFFAIVS